MILGEWTGVENYELAGVPTQDNIFLAHRSVTYEATNTPLGSSDSELSIFPLAIPLIKAETAYSLKRGDCVLITGKVFAPHLTGVLKDRKFDWARIYVVATDIKKIG